MSVWTFGTPFIKTGYAGRIMLDQPLLGLLGQARLDDLSLVHTVTFDTANPPGCSGPRGSDPAPWRACASPTYAR
jgi:hypothetical protein